MKVIKSARLAQRYNMEQVDSSTELHLNRKDLAALTDDVRDVVKEEVILESPGHHHNHHQVRKQHWHWRGDCANECECGSGSRLR